MPQGDADWIKARIGKITASRAGDVLDRKKNGEPGAKYLGYRAELIAERLSGRAFEHYVTKAMQDGIDNEEDARYLYELETGVDVIETGFHVHPIIDYFGASPDGLIGDDGLVEIKCLTMANHVAVLETEEVDARYIAQMQAQMACTERQWCDYVGYSPNYDSPYSLWIKRFERDEAFIADLLEKAAELDADVAEAVEKLRSRYAA